MEIPDELQSKLLECPPEVIADIIHLHEVIESLEFSIKELEPRLNLNSTNIGKPPSNYYGIEKRKKEIGICTKLTRKAPELERGSNTVH